MAAPVFPLPVSGRRRRVPARPPAVALAVGPGWPGKPSRIDADGRDGSGCCLCLGPGVSGSQIGAYAISVRQRSEALAGAAGPGVVIVRPDGSITTAPEAAYSGPGVGSITQTVAGAARISRARVSAAGTNRAASVRTGSATGVAVSVSARDAAFKSISPGRIWAAIYARAVPCGPVTTTTRGP